MDTFHYISQKTKLTMQFAYYIFFAFFSTIANSATIVGWAEMDEHTFAAGPTSRQFVGEKGSLDKQTVGGFSGVLSSNREDTYYFLADNGYGAQHNSADFLLRLYEVHIQFRDKNNAQDNVQVLSYLNLNDSRKHLGFKIQGDYPYYYNLDHYPSLDKRIQQSRLLTGADFDPESIQIDKNGHFWIGDEFGPYLLKVSPEGSLLRSEISLAQVWSSDNHTLGSNEANALGGGFEAIAISPSGKKLYAMLEDVLKGDASNTVKIYEFDTKTEQYTGVVYQYRLDVYGMSVTDMAAVNEHQFLVLERASSEGDKKNPLKKVFLVDFNEIDHDGLVSKKALVNLMQLSDPDDLNADGKSMYAFPDTHIESLMILNKNTLLVGSDNNFHSSSHFIKVKLDEPLDWVVSNTLKIDKSAWQANRFFLGQVYLGDHSFWGWVTIDLYFIASMSFFYRYWVSKKQNETEAFWLLLCLCLFLLGINRQFDLLQSITGNIRNYFMEYGWYESRVYSQGGVIFFAVLSLSMLLISARIRLFAHWKRHKALWLSIAFLLFFLALKATSNHTLDAIFHKKAGTLKVYQALELSLLIWLLINTYLDLHRESKLTRMKR